MKKTWDRISVGTRMLAMNGVTTSKRLAGGTIYAAALIAVMAPKQADADTFALHVFNSNEFSTLTVRSVKIKPHDGNWISLSPGPNVEFGPGDCSAGNLVETLHHLETVNNLRNQRRSMTWDKKLEEVTFGRWESFFNNYWSDPPRPVDNSDTVCNFADHFVATPLAWTFDANQQNSGPTTYWRQGVEPPTRFKKGSIWRRGRLKSGFSADAASLNCRDKNARWSWRVSLTIDGQDKTFEVQSSRSRYSWSGQCFNFLTLDPAGNVFLADQPVQMSHDTRLPEGVLPPSLHNSPVYINSVSNSRLALHAWGGTAAGDRIKLHHCGASSNYPNCQWILVPSTHNNGAYYFKLKENDFYLYASDGIKSGSALTINSCDTGANDLNCQFYLLPAAYGYQDNTGKNRWHSVFTLRPLSGDLQVAALNTPNAPASLEQCFASGTNFGGINPYVTPNCGWTIQPASDQKDPPAINGVPTHEWVRANQLLKQVSVAYDGSVWGVDEDSKIWKMVDEGNSSDEWPFVEIEGPLEIGVEGGKGLSQVSVGNRNAVWGVDSRDDVWKWGGGDQWDRVGDSHLKQISVGNDGTVVGVDSADKIWKWNGVDDNKWVFERLGTKHDRLSQVSVAQYNSIWGVNSAGLIWYWSATSQEWKNVANGKLVQVSVAPDNTVWGVNSKDEVWRWNAYRKDWDQMGGKLVQVAVGEKNRIWAISRDDSGVYSLWYR